VSARAPWSTVKARNTPDATRDAPRRRSRSLASRLATNHRIAVLGAALLLPMVLLAVSPSLFSTHDPLDPHLPDFLQAPSGNHWLGTDHIGRDVYSRSVHGARITLWVGVVSVLLSTIAGTFLGLVTGYLGGPLDRIVMAFVDAGMAIPTIFLALVMLAVLGRGLENLVLAIAISSLPRFVYLIRPQVLSLCETDLVAAARSLGASTARVMFRHVLPNLGASLIVLISNRVAAAILIESSLNFLGVGVAPPTPTWGNMIAEGRTYLASAPWYPLSPGAFIMLTVLGFNLIGDGLRDALDPRLVRDVPMQKT
jgi:peptide/nickel transport system permease protein